MASRMKQHLIDMGEHFAKMAKCHQDANNDFEGGDVFHKSAAAANLEMCEKCLSMAKADGGDDERDFSKLQPTKISAVNPSPQPRPVYREGQRIMPAGAGDAVPNTPSIFSKVFGDITAEE